MSLLAGQAQQNGLLPAEQQCPVREAWRQVGVGMSEYGAAIRSTEQIAAYRKQVQQQLAELPGNLTVPKLSDLQWLFRLRDTLICQDVYLAAMEDYAANGGKSRGSALYTDFNGQKPYPTLPDTFTFVLDDGSRGDLVQEVSYRNGSCTFRWRPVRPIPEDDDFFENVWRAYRETGNID